MEAAQALKVKNDKESEVYENSLQAYKAAADKKRKEKIESDKKAMMQLNKQQLEMEQKMKQKEQEM